MAKVNICNVVVLDNPCPFRRPFEFEITFECSEDLQEDLEWKITYVGSAESEQMDQILDTVVVGPIVAGRHKFVFKAPPPDADKIPLADIVGVTVVLLTCAYRNKEFIRVGYYVNNEYEDPELRENPPSVPNFDMLTRNILATCPRVTRFKIDWDEGGSDANSENMPPPFAAENTESNPMAVDQAAGAAGGAQAVSVLGASENTMDGNSMEIAAAHAKLGPQDSEAPVAPVAPPVMNGADDHTEEAMEQS